MRSTNYFFLSLRSLMYNICLREDSNTQIQYLSICEFSITSTVSVCDREILVQLRHIQYMWLRNLGSQNSYYNWEITYFEPRDYILEKKQGLQTLKKKKQKSHPKNIQEQGLNVNFSSRSTKKQASRVYQRINNKVKIVDLSGMF